MEKYKFSVTDKNIRGCYILIVTQKETGQPGLSFFQIANIETSKKKSNFVIDKFSYTAEN